MQIPLNQFEQYIDETILKRGLSYFKNGHVNEPEEISPGLYEAIVEGTEDYLVKLTIKNENIVEHVCNCPYDMGPVCKHVVAVIFHLQQDVLELKKKTSNSKSSPRKKPAKRKTIADKVLELVETVSHDELKQFIIEKTEQNRPFRDLFLSSFAHLNSNESKELYKKQVKSMLQSASDSHGFIGWSSSRDVNSFIVNLLDSAQKQIEKKNYKSAVFICTAIMEQLTEAIQYVDDSSGYIGGNIDYAYEMLHNIAEEDLTEDIRKLILEYCIKAFDENIYSGWDWHTGMLHISSLLLKSDDETERVLTQIDKAQRSEYEREEAQSIKYSILKKMNGEKEADLYLEQNITNPNLRSQAISIVLENKDYDKATSVALDGISHDKEEKPGLVKKWYNWLLKIAQAKNDKEKTIEYSRLLFIENSSREQDYYQILKENIQPGQWTKFVEEVIKDITTENSWLDTGLIAGIYIKEEWWSKLLEILKRSPDLRTVEHYEKYLSKDYADELVQLYSEAIIEYLKYNMGRGSYQTACRYLRRIIKLGDREKTNEIIAILRAEYPKRKALKEELDNV
jgi:hypothetical protein